MKYHGTKVDLMQILFTVAPGGHCQAADDGLRYRTGVGATVKWWRSTGTITIQGKPDAAKTLRLLIAPAIAAYEKAGDAGLKKVKKLEVPRQPHPGRRMK